MGNAPAAQLNIFTIIWELSLHYTRYYTYDLEKNNLKFVHNNVSYHGPLKLTTISYSNFE